MNQLFFHLDPAERITEMNETITQLDSKVADLETENESLREERTILRERVKVMTCITLCHTILTVNDPKEEVLENIVGKDENAGN